MTMTMYQHCTKKNFYGILHICFSRLEMNLALLLGTINHP